jgi:hypothetical protein
LTALQSRVDRGARPAVLLSSMAGALAVGAAGALLVGWFWSGSRGDWQAFVLWGYWLGTPFLCGVSLAIAAGWPSLKRANLTLLGLWGAVSLFVLLIPFLPR